MFEYQNGNFSKEMRTNTVFPSKKWCLEKSTGTFFSQRDSQKVPVLFQKEPVLFLQRKRRFCLLKAKKSFFSYRHRKNMLTNSQYFLKKVPILFFKHHFLLGKTVWMWFFKSDWIIIEEKFSQDNSLYKILKKLD